MFAEQAGLPGWGQRQVRGTLAAPHKQIKPNRPVGNFQIMFQVTGYWNEYIVNPWSTTV